MRPIFRLSTLIIALTLFAANAYGAGKLRLLTWNDYAPADIIADFTQQTGIEVEVTLSNNEDMVAKLRAGGRFDLAQPSQDRIASAQTQFDLYKPLDLDKIQTDLFVPAMLAATEKYTTVNDRVYGVPHTWGTTGLIVNVERVTDIRGFDDLCKPELAGRMSFRLKRPLLIGFAFALGMDPFSAYDDAEDYRAILDTVAAKLIACLPNLQRDWSQPDQLANLFRSDEIYAAMGWDSIGWMLNSEKPAIRYLAPSSGALGWIDTFALPASGENDEAAYQWINFVMQPKVAARITNTSRFFTASKEADRYVEPERKKQLADSLPPKAIGQIRWFPPVSAELETVERTVLERIRAQEELTETTR